MILKNGANRDAIGFTGDFVIPGLTYNHIKPAELAKGNGYNGKFMADHRIMDIKIPGSS